jgi:U3 small nucleolar RNA-associated protein 21
MGKDTFQITTSVGRTLQTYDLRRGLNLVFLTRPQTPEDITATLAWGTKVLAAWGGQGLKNGGGVWIFKRGKKVEELQMPSHDCEKISQLLIFGSWIVGCGESRIEVWKSSDLEHYTTLYSRAGGDSRHLAGGICSMPTYLNKICAGRADGRVEIWNVSTGRLLYTILPSSPEDGAVTALQPAPALSLIAIAYESGLVKIHNIRADKTLFCLNKGAKSPVTSISFRTDGLGAGEDGQNSGVMATASRANGDVTFWDLNDGGRKMGVLRGAHSPPSADGKVAGGIGKVEFLIGQGVIVTSGLDNSLKSWIFDEQLFSPVPRILHSRSGHAAPVSNIYFVPAEADSSDAHGKWLLSASQDRSLWAWSLRRDGSSAEVSQGNILQKARKLGILNNSLSSTDTGSLEELKAPPITSIACNLNRDGGIGALPGKQSIWALPGEEKKSKTQNAETSAMTGWESVVTAHKDDRFARTWFWGRKRAGRWKFASGDDSEVSVGIPSIHYRSLSLTI